MKKPTRVVLSCDMTPEAYALFKTVERRAWVQKIVLSRVVTWFTRLPAAEQTRIMEQDDAEPPLVAS